MWTSLIDGAFLIAVLGALWKIASLLGAVKNSVETIMSNHLPHVQQEISELRREFIAHVDKNRSC